MYLFLFKSPRNSTKIIHLAKQISPYDNKFFIQSYKSATVDEFTYILFDFHKSPPQKLEYDQKHFQVKGQ